MSDFRLFFRDCFSQPCAIHLAKMVVDVSSTTSVSVRKAFEDRNAITVGSFDFSLKKKKSRIISPSRLSFSLCHIFPATCCARLKMFTAVENCAPERMNFNGFSNCSCGSSSLSCCVLCSLNCGVDGVFEYPPASVYSCEYAEAKFVPENIPQCIFGKYEKHETWSVLFN